MTVSKDFVARYFNSVAPVSFPVSFPVAYAAVLGCAVVFAAPVTAQETDNPVPGVVEDETTAPETAEPETAESEATEPDAEELETEEPVATETVAPERPPRVDGVGVAEATDIAISELNASAYPEMTIFATVTLDGVPVTGLGAEDFRVREDEVDQEPLTVAAQLPPLSVVVAVDTSGSMSRAMEATRTAAQDFIGSLAPDDNVQLLTFAREITTVTPMTSDKDEVIDAAGALAARGDTALYDAVLQSVELLEEVEGRKAIIVLSDGVDDNGAGEPLSVATVDDALARAGEVNLPVFTIGLGTEMDETILQLMADETGAIYLNAPDAESLSGVYGQIGDQLSGQYAISYTSNLPADGTSRRVDLEAFDLTASRSYTAEGSIAAEPVATTGCATADALNASRPELEELVGLFEDDLVSAVTLNSERAALSEPGLSASETTTENYECLLEALEAGNALHDDELITAVSMNRLQANIGAAVSADCQGVTDLAAIESCYELMNRAHDDGLVTAVGLNRFRADTNEPLIDMLRALDDPREALEMLNDFYERDLITAVTLNRMRSEIRASVR